MKILTGFVYTGNNFRYGKNLRHKLGKILFVKRETGNQEFDKSTSKWDSSEYNLMIETSSIEKAIDICESIYASHVIISEDHIIDPFEFFDCTNLLREHSEFALYLENAPKIMEKITQTDYDYLYLANVNSLDFKKFDTNLKEYPLVLSTPFFYDATFCACKASFRRKFLYALYKLCLSHVLINVPWTSLGIDRETLPKPSLKKRYPYNLQIRILPSLLFAYSAIEELDLHVKREDRANEKGRLTYIDENGHLLSETRKRIEKRLEKAGIKKDIPIGWMRKGLKTTFLEKQYYEKVKEKIDVPYALYIAKCLRDLAAHAVTLKSSNEKMIETISLYEVGNVQNLARLLLLKSLKFDFRGHC